MDHIFNETFQIVSGCKCTHITPGSTVRLNMTSTSFFFLLAEPFWSWLEPYKLSQLGFKIISMRYSPFYYYNFFYNSTLSSLNLSKSKLYGLTNICLTPTPAHKTSFGRCCEEFFFCTVSSFNKILREIKR